MVADSTQCPFSHLSSPLVKSHGNVFVYVVFSLIKLRYISYCPYIT